jgi:hypothetical protein
VEGLKPNEADDESISLNWPILRAGKVMATSRFDPRSRLILSTQAEGTAALLAVALLLAATVERRNASEALVLAQRGARS